jgi:hypothetical protein
MQTISSPTCRKPCRINARGLVETDGIQVTVYYSHGF